MEQLYDWSEGKCKDMYIYGDVVRTQWKEGGAGCSRAGLHPLCNDFTEISNRNSNGHM